MPKVKDAQTVTGGFAKELLQPPYAFQDEEPSSSSISIGAESADGDKPLQLVQKG
jgi:hypothetical protein